jgi:hypothetical protein
MDIYNIHTYIHIYICISQATEKADMLRQRQACKLVAQAQQMLGMRIPSSKYLPAPTPTPPSVTPPPPSVRPGTLVAPAADMPGMRTGMRSMRCMYALRMPVRKTETARSWHRRQTCAACMRENRNCFISIYVSSCYCICVLMLLHACPHATIYVSACYYMCVRMLLHVSSH